jgi:small subunit ribosomal protein S16
LFERNFVAVKIRLMRVGKKKQPTYRVVVADSRSPRDGRIIETIGHYGPRQEPSFVDIDADRALDWLRKGAKPTEQAQKLLTVSGVWETFTAERPEPDTKLNRRGHVTGRGPAKNTVKSEKPAPEPKAEAAPADEPADEPAEASDAAPVEDAPAEESAAEESE